MMIIDQNGENAINLDQISRLQLHSWEQKSFALIAYTCDGKDYIIGMFSTAEKAVDAFNDLLEHVDWAKVKS